MDEEIEFQFLLKREHTFPQKLRNFAEYGITTMILSNIQLETNKNICGQHIKFKNKSCINIYLPNWNFKRVNILGTEYDITNNSTNSIVFDISEDFMINEICNTIAHEYLHNTLYKCGIDGISPENKKIHEILIKKLGF